MAGVYISYPFCTQKCSFCNFASGVSSAGTIADYGTALLRQLRAHVWEWTPETLYLGGGTPSLMTLETLSGVMRALPKVSWREATMEAMPGSLTAEKARGWRELGIQRVSLGVQSFVGVELQQSGRRHSAETVAGDVALLQAAGITNINLDLIAGLPGQTMASWHQSLDWIERLQAPHVSVYLFEMDEDSRLGQEMLLGGVRYGAAAMPSDDAMAALYETALERLAAMGLRRYEISNFAQPGMESVHNLKYWQLQPYVGFGLDAHSFDGIKRYSTCDELTDYLKDPLRRVNETGCDLGQEHFFVGLRLDAGISPEPEEWTRFAGPIESWTRDGMLEREGGRLRLAKAGVLLSNEIFEDFLR